MTDHAHLPCGVQYVMAEFHFSGCQRPRNVKCSELACNEMQTITMLARWRKASVGLWSYFGYRIKVPSLEATSVLMDSPS